MKHIFLLELRLVNFKGIRNLTVYFSSTNGITTIQGANGTGKTTVFDAFTWLLFGKDSTDRKGFNIKTLDANGNPIERLPHEVSAVIEVHDESANATDQITLCRRYSEKWTKKRGSATEEFVGHEEERLYNDVPMSVRDWNTKIAAICDEQVFKFITNPLYFTGQKADVQRAMLFRMAGDVSDTQIAEGKPEFADLLARITGKTMEEYKREIAAKKRRLKAEIEAIPERIEERKRDVLPPEDWDALTKELAAVQATYNDSLNLFTSAQTAYDAAAQERDQLRQRHAQLKQERYRREVTIKAQVFEGYDRQATRQMELNGEAQRIRKECADLQRAIANRNAQIEQCGKVRETLIARWRTINAEELVINDEEFVCPTCQRRYGVAEVQTRAAELTRRFNQSKAERIAENNKQGKANKARMEQLAEQNSTDEGIIAKLQQRLAEIEADPLFAATLVQPDATTDIATDAEIINLDNLIAEVEAKLEQPMEATPGNDKSQLVQLTAKINNLKVRLAGREVIKRTEERIAELETALRTMSQELAELEGVEFTMQQFAKARVEAMEQRINGLFKVVRFKLFEQQINGGEVETCVATVNGVPMPDVNNAGKIIAGLDIINAICDFEGICAPIFCDNAESVNQLPKMRSQMVRLVVTDDKELTVCNN